MLALFQGVFENWNKWKNYIVPTIDYMIDDKKKRPHSFNSRNIISFEFTKIKIKTHLNNYFF